MDLLDGEVALARKELQELRQEERSLERERRRELNRLQSRVAYLDQKLRQRMKRGNDTRFYTRAMESTYSRRQDRPSQFVLNRQALLLSVSHHIEIVMNAKELAGARNKAMIERIIGLISSLEDEKAKVESTHVKQRCLLMMEMRRLNRNFSNESMPQRMVIDKLHEMLLTPDEKLQRLKQRHGSLDDSDSRRRGGRARRRFSSDDVKARVSAVNKKLRSSLVKFLDRDTTAKSEDGVDDEDALIQRMQHVLLDENSKTEESKQSNAPWRRNRMRASIGTVKH